MVFSKDERKGVDACAYYLVKYREMLHYDRFPIATGVIEGTCRHLVKDHGYYRGTLAASLQRRYGGLLDTRPKS